MVIRMYAIMLPVTEKAAKTSSAALYLNQLNYIIPPPIPGLAGAAGSGAGISVTAHSVVRIREAMDAAF